MKSLLCGLSLLLASPAFAQQIGNGGLEKWQIGTHQTPDSFFTFDDFTTSPGAVTRTTSAHSGSYAALLTTVTSPFGPAAGGMFYGCGIDSMTFSTNGWPFTGRPTRFKFWYKYSRAGNDSALGAAILFKWKNGMRTAIGTGIVFITANTSTYTQAVEQISYMEAAQPDSILIYFSSSNEIMTLGSTLYVDDISFDYTTGIEEPAGTGKLNLYPNPVTGTLTLELPDAGISEIVITDITGKSLFHRQPAAGQKFSIDCRSWPSGMYFVTVRNREHVSKGKFIRE